MGNTVIAVYEADGDAEKAFKRLDAIYNSNYIKDAIYGAVIDLPPSVCYSTVSDERIVDAAKRYYDEIKRGKRERFFCALRPRRYLTDRNELKKYRSSYARFACEKGALGALESLISGNGSFFAYFGTDSFSECDKLYFSAYDNGVLPYPGTVNGLCELFETKKAVFPQITVGKKSFYDIREGLYPFGECIGYSVSREYRVGKSELNAKKPCAPNEPVLQRFTDIALRGIIEIYRNGEIKTVTDAAMLMCATVALRVLRRFGNEEAFEVSENIFIKLKELFFAGSSELNDGETAFLLTLLAGAYSKLSSEYPEFHFLKNDAKEMARIILRHVKNGKRDPYGFLCSKDNYAEIDADKLSFIAKTVIFGAKSDAIKVFLNGRSGIFSDDVRAMTAVLIYAAQNAFWEYPNLLPEIEYKIRYLRCAYETESFCESEKIYERPYLSNAEKLIYTPGFYPLRMRFAERGCDVSLLPFAAYLERCRACQERKENKRFTLTLFADSAYPLVKLILRASLIDLNADICVVTKDIYSHNALKKASSGRARLMTHDECSVKEMRALSAVVRQITPYTVLAELLEEVENSK